MLHHDVVARWIAAAFASDNLLAATLKLRSMAMATAKGKSPAAKFEIVCGAPSSRSSKSLCVSPLIGCPCSSVTLA